MTKAILKINGRIVPRRTTRRLTTEYLHSDSEKAVTKAFDDSIKRIHGDSMYLPDKVPEPDSMRLSDIDDDNEDPFKIPYDNLVDATGNAIYEKPFTDMRIQAKVIFTQGGDVHSSKFHGRTQDGDANIVDTFDSNPILNSILYDVEFSDGAVKQYATDIITENMYIQVDSDVHSALILDVIVDYSKDDTSVAISEKYVTTRPGTRRLLHTTEGWHLLVQWKYGSEKLVSLKLLKEHNPVEIFEFSKSRNISDKPDLCWWVLYTLRKIDRIIAAVNDHALLKTHKYGI